MEVAASIIAVIQLADRIAGACKAYIDGVQGYPKDLRLMHLEIKQLAAVFETLSLLDRDDPDDLKTLSHLEGPDGPIEGCRTAAEALSSLVSSSPHAIRGTKSKRQKLQASLETLAWPLKENQARKLLEDIGRHKATISGAIGGAVLREVHAIKKTLSEAQVREVCDWFKKTDPSPLHNTALGNYELGTCDWVLRHPEWKDWLSLATRCVWIHGIPGAGKTVLAAHLISQLYQICHKRGNKKVTTVYYYCYHGHGQDESDSFLRWTINQLCRRLGGIPEIVHDQFREGQQPNIQGLLTSLESVLQNYETVYLVIDALDESQIRERLLHLIEVLLTEKRFAKLQILATSRQYLDIETAMVPLSRAISMSNPLVEVDIMLYIQAYIQKDPKIRKWPEDLRIDVQNELSRGARGMFRWAVCQLDILKRLRHESLIRSAIRDLPETLDETYERIFRLIPEEERDLVRHTLNWLSLCDSVQHEDGSKTEGIMRDPQIIHGVFLLEVKGFSAGNGDCGLFNDYEHIKEACGCLVTFREVSEVCDSSSESSVLAGSDVAIASASGSPAPYECYIAHYTVYEFLRSNRASSDAAVDFKMEGQSGHSAIWNQIFNVATMVPPDYSRSKNPNEDDAKKTIETCRRLGAELMANMYFAGHLITIDHVLEFFDPLGPQFACLHRHFHNCKHIDSGSVPYFGVQGWKTFQGSQIIAKWLSATHAVVCMRSYCAIPWRTSNDSKGDSLLFFGERLLREVACDQSFQIQIPAPFGGTHSFSGNALEFFSYWGGCPNAVLNPFLLFLSSVKQTIDLTRMLYLQIAVHHPYKCLADECNIKALLAKGGCTESTSCPVTALQIAVARRNRVAVSHLLEAGADPNRCQLSEVDDWGEDAFLGPCYHLGTMSPLQILNKTGPIIAPDRVGMLGDRLRAGIRKRLKKAGAVEFEL